MIKLKSTHFFIIVIMLFSSHYTFSQITLNTNNEESTVYVDNIKVGKGSTMSTKTPKYGSVQIVNRTPNYKDTYYALLKPSFKVLDISPTHKYLNRSENEKFIGLQSIKFNLKDIENDIIAYNINYTTNNNEILADAAKIKDKINLKLAEKIEKKGAVETLKDDNSRKFIHDQYSEVAFSLLKKMNYIDTLKSILNGKNNKILLEAEITKVNRYNMGKLLGKYFTEECHKINLHINWRIKNIYGETIDSIYLEEFSGEFIDSYNKGQYISMNDAIENSLIVLVNDEKFRKYLPREKSFASSDPMLTINKPSKIVTALTDANDASIIVKNGKSHGSGFAISHDGYILTNYHVIAADNIDKFEAIKVLTSNGDEFDAKIVRFNRKCDIALLKIEHTFETAFLLSETKAFKNLQAVYTIGTPSSIELGQSVSNGILSNERKSEFIYLLQVNMAVSPGNSGGPLFDKAGLLHGVITSKLIGFGSEGVSFAIPSHMVPGYLNIKYSDK